ncbi:MAG: prolipoprotein diacylglyceryl transferase family protein [Desulfomonilaceae bacterium]
MYNEIFVFALGTSFVLLFSWAFKTLPRENWQILATIPWTKDTRGNWQGLNITYYGFFIALATSVAVAILLILTSSIGVPISTTFLLAVFILLIGLITSKVIASLVENKPYTFTIAGACFSGVFIVPPTVWALDHLNPAGSFSVPPIPMMAALAIAYTFGEGLGRLACISFGCCYGKPLSHCRPNIARFLGKYVFVFTGKMKKIAYESGLDGQRVVPVQAMTALLHVAAGLVTICLFLKGHFTSALMIAMVSTQCWRVLSETLRADFRGHQKFTAYQMMALVSIPYVFLSASLLSGLASPTPDIKVGVGALWDPAAILFIEIAGLATFLWTGRSMVTASTISFRVMKDRI